MVPPVIGGSKGGARDTPPPGAPNSFIFMQFLGTKLKNNSTFGSWRTPVGKILDPPLRTVQFENIRWSHLLYSLCNVMCCRARGSERAGSDSRINREARLAASRS